MPIDEIRYQEIVKELNATNVTLVAVSKTKRVEDIQALYDLGQRDFGENYVQELTEKAPQLPGDAYAGISGTRSNRSNTSPFIHLVHVVDSPKLLQEINSRR
jgi:uncharacterized pyridoxal phosphate-containing UPF0001 family protein